jgi:Fe-S-cluster containining protein
VKPLDPEDLESLPGLRLREGDTFRFRCHPGVACFNRCCRNLNLFLYPYDVLRLRARLGVTSEEFLERHADAVLRPGSFFPDVLLRMAENSERTCPFLTAEGCGVYPDRPDTCRTFPLEQGLLHDPGSRADVPVYFFRPPEFCLGRHEDSSWSVPQWVEDQEAGDYHRMTIRWAEVRRLFLSDPWGGEGPQGPRARMAFMAAYNIDRFREFVFGSSFLKRFKITPELQRRVKKDDVELMLLGFDWIKLFLWGITNRRLKPRKR